MKAIDLTDLIYSKLVDSKQYQKFDSTNAEFMSFDSDNKINIELINGQNFTLTIEEAKK